MISFIIYGQAMLNRVIYLKSCCKIKMKLLPLILSTIFTAGVNLFVLAQISRNKMNILVEYFESVFVTFFATKAIVKSSLTLPESGFSLQKSSLDLVCYYHYTTLFA